MYKFDKIPSVRVAQKEFGSLLTEPTTLVVSEKIHGTNIGMSYHIVNGKLLRESGVPQSRNNILDGVNIDNYGAYTFMMERSYIIADIIEYIMRNIKSNLDNVARVIMFGELAGKGIQAKSALTGIEKSFLPFTTITFVDRDERHYEVLYSDFDTPQFRSLWKRAEAENIIPLGAYQHPAIYHKVVGGRLSLLIDEWTKKVKELEDNSPFGNLLGVKGNVMEGVVINCWEEYNPQYLNKPSRKVKIKGDKHKTKGVKVKRRQAVELNDKEKELLDLATDVGRFEQAISELFTSQDVDIDMQHISTYLKWINLDIREELKDLIEDPEVNYKNIQKHVAKEAKAFFMEQLTKHIGGTDE